MFFFPTTAKSSKHLANKKKTTMVYISILLLLEVHSIAADHYAKDIDIWTHTNMFFLPSAHFRVSVDDPMMAKIILLADTHRDDIDDYQVPIYAGWARKDCQ